MIKLVAALTMLIDHIGLVLFPETIAFRIIGRLSMPLYAYCVARGFYHSNQHGTAHKYLKRMLILSLVSQLPYCFMGGESLNICFTWSISLLLLISSTARHPSPLKRVLAQVLIFGVVTILVLLKLVPVEYGISGLAAPLFFFFLIKNKKENGVNYTLALVVLWAIFVLVDRGNMVQIVSVASGPVLTMTKRFDEKVKLPKEAFYAFYPLHILVLLVIRYLQV